jgi:transposase
MDLRMSAKERDRLRIVSQTSEGKLSMSEGAGLSGVSERQFRRVLSRWRSEGDAGLVHRLRGRASNRRLSAELRAAALEQLRGPYTGFGPTLASEKLREHDGIAVSRETVRKWMAGEGLWQPRRRGVTHRSWRERRSCFGELVQMDTSEHDWFEGRGEKCVLLAMIDDATSVALLRFASSDTTASNMSLLKTWVARNGRPMGLYVDRAGHFQVNRPTTVEEDLADLPAEAQIGRALRELGIKHVVAHSPQAKGRVERLFGTCQDRLVKELRLRGIGTIAEANAYLEREFMPMWNARFTVAPAREADAHRSAAGYDLDAILSHQEERVVQNDYTVRYRNVRYQIARGSVRAGLRGSKVTVEERLDGSVRLRWRGGYLTSEARGDARMRPSATAHAGAGATVGLRPPSAPAPAPKPRRLSSANKPASDHPWRKPYKRTLLLGRKPDIPTLR